MREVEWGEIQNKWEEISDPSEKVRVSRSQRVKTEWRSETIYLIPNQEEIDDTDIAKRPS